MQRASLTALIICHVRARVAGASLGNSPAGWAQPAKRIKINLHPLSNMCCMLSIMPGYRAKSIGSLSADDLRTLVCPYCRLLLRNAVQTVEDGIRLCESCKDLSLK